MSTKNRKKTDSPFSLPSASGTKIGIVVADWNPEITSAMNKSCISTLKEHGIKEENIIQVRVPGAFELPLGARIMLSSQSLDAVICIGCVIKGETTHDEYINQSVALGISQLALATSKPIIFGVLTTLNEQQALDRAGGKLGNKGEEAAMAAIQMIDLKHTFIENKQKIGFS